MHRFHRSLISPFTMLSLSFLHGPVQEIKANWELRMPSHNQHEMPPQLRLFPWEGVPGSRSSIAGDLGARAGFPGQRKDHDAGIGQRTGWPSSAIFEPGVARAMASTLAARQARGVTTSRLLHA